MKSEKAAERLSRYLDGALPPADRVAIEARLRSDPSFRALREEFEAIGRDLRALPLPEGPTPEAAWAAVRRGLRPGSDRGVGDTVPWISGSRLWWTGATVALLFLLLGVWALRRGPSPGPGFARTAPAEVEWVETDLPHAMTMVYQDEETGLTVIWVMEEEKPEPAHVDS